MSSVAPLGCLLRGNVTAGAVGSAAAGPLGRPMSLRAEQGGRLGEARDWLAWLACGGWPSPAVQRGWHLRRRVQ